MISQRVLARLCPQSGASRSGGAPLLRFLRSATVTISRNDGLNSVPHALRCSSRLFSTPSSPSSSPSSASTPFESFIRGLSEPSTTEAEHRTRPKPSSPSSSLLRSPFGSPFGPLPTELTKPSSAATKSFKQQQLQDRENEASTAATEQQEEQDRQVDVMQSELMNVSKMNLMGYTVHKLHLAKAQYPTLRHFVMQVSERVNDKPTAETLNILLEHAYIEAKRRISEISTSEAQITQLLGQISLAIQDLIDANAKPAYRSIAKIYHLYIKLDRLDELWKIHQLLTSANYEYSTDTFEALITGLGRASKPTLLIKEFKKRASKGGEISQRGFFEIISSCSASGVLEDMLSAFELMVERKISPDEKVFQKMIRGYGRHGKVQEMIETLGQMRVYNVHPSDSTLMLALECLGENCAWEEFEMMFCHLLKLNPSNPNLVINAALRSVKKSCYGIYLLWCLVKEKGSQISNNFYYETLENLLAPFEEEEITTPDSHRAKLDTDDTQDTGDHNSEILSESLFDRQLRSHMVLEILQVRPVSAKIQKYFPRISKCLSLVHDSDKERATRVRDEILRFTTKR